MNRKSASDRNVRYHRICPTCKHEQMTRRRLDEKYVCSNCREYVK